MEDWAGLSLIRLGRFLTQVECEQLLKGLVKLEVLVDYEVVYINNRKVEDRTACLIDILLKKFNMALYSKMKNLVGEKFGRIESQFKAGWYTDEERTEYWRARRRIKSLDFKIMKTVSDSLAGQTSWPDLAGLLGLTNVTADVRHDVIVNLEKFHRHVIYLLTEWGVRCPNVATVGFLVAALREIKVNDLADEIEVKFILAEEDQTNQSLNPDDVRRARDREAVLERVVIYLNLPENQDMQIYIRRGYKVLAVEVINMLKQGIHPTVSSLLGRQAHRVDPKIARALASEKVLESLLRYLCQPENCDLDVQVADDDHEEGTSIKSVSKVMFEALVPNSKALLVEAVDLNGRLTLDLTQFDRKVIENIIGFLFTSSWGHVHHHLLSTYHLSISMGFSRRDWSRLIELKLGGYLNFENMFDSLYWAIQSQAGWIINEVMVFMVINRNGVYVSTQLKHAKPIVIYYIASCKHTYLDTPDWTQLQLVKLTQNHPFVCHEILDLVVREEFHQLTYSDIMLFLYGDFFSNQKSIIDCVTFLRQRYVEIDKVESLLRNVYFTPEKTLKYFIKIHQIRSVWPGLTINSLTDQITKIVEEKTKLNRQQIKALLRLDEQLEIHTSDTSLDLTNHQILKSLIDRHIIVIWAKTKNLSYQVVRNGVCFGGDCKRTEVIPHSTSFWDAVDLNLEAIISEDAENFLEHIRIIIEFTPKHSTEEVVSNELNMTKQQATDLILNTIERLKVILKKLKPDSWWFTDYSYSWVLIDQLEYVKDSRLLNFVMEKELRISLRELQLALVKCSECLYGEFLTRFLRLLPRIILLSDWREFLIRRVNMDPTYDNVTTTRGFMELNKTGREVRRLKFSDYVVMRFMFLPYIPVIRNEVFARSVCKVILEKNSAIARLSEEDYLTTEDNVSKRLIFITMDLVELTGDTTEITFSHGIIGGTYLEFIVLSVDVRQLCKMATVKTEGESDRESELTSDCSRRELLKDVIKKNAPDVPNVVYLNPPIRVEAVKNYTLLVQLKYSDVYNFGCGDEIKKWRRCGEYCKVLLGPNKSPGSPVQALGLYNFRE